MDRFGNAGDRDGVSPFIELLWKRGTAYERKVIESLDIPFLDLSAIEDNDEREKATRRALEAGEGLIYHGRLTVDNLRGEPDLLRRQNGGYVAGDIKSGAGVEGATDDSDGKPKKHYAAQLALYTDLLERIGHAAGRTPFVWDIHGDEIVYQLDEPQGKRTPETWWQLYERVRDEAVPIAAGDQATLPALSSICKLCHWRTVCKNSLQKTDDLTLIPELGRAKRDALLGGVDCVAKMAAANIATLPKIKGIGEKSLKKFQARAQLQVTADASPYLLEPLNLPEADKELHFDIETDPMRDIVYMHGFVERTGRDNATERYVVFVAEQPTPEEERRAFAAAWEFVQAAAPCVLYYYSPFERTNWRKLQERYPDVASADDIERMFDPAVAVDLYLHAVKSKSEWPTHDYSIKTLARFLGFKWRDTDPSGAASIEWYDRWVETGDPAVRQRIIDYNEDDCRAMRVLLDALRSFPSVSAASK